MNFKQFTPFIGKHIKNDEEYIFLKGYHIEWCVGYNNTTELNFIYIATINMVCVVYGCVCVCVSK